MKFTQYFLSIRQRPHRTTIKLVWIERVIQNPVKEIVQEDGRIRIWWAVPEFEGKFLRVVLLEDRETVHNAFFDRRFEP